MTDVTHGGDSSDSGVCGGDGVGGGGGGDAMIAVIADTESSEEAISNASPIACSRKASSSVDIEPYQVLPYDARKFNPNPTSSTTMSLSVDENGSDAGCDGGHDGDSGIVNRVTKTDLSPTVLKQVVTTTAYRY